MGLSKRPDSVSKNDIGNYLDEILKLKHVNSTFVYFQLDALKLSDQYIFKPVTRGDKLFPITVYILDSDWNNVAKFYDMFDIAVLFYVCEYLQQTEILKSQYRLSFHEKYMKCVFREFNINIHADINIRSDVDFDIEKFKMWIPFSHMNISVKMPTGKIVELKVTGDTISDIKEKIKEKENIPIYKQRLLFLGNELNDDYHIKEGSKLVLDSEFTKMADALDLLDINEKSTLQSLFETAYYLPSLYDILREKNYNYADVYKNLRTKGVSQELCEKILNILNIKKETDYQMIDSVTLEKKKKEIMILLNKTDFLKNPSMFINYNQYKVIPITDKKYVIETVGDFMAKVAIRPDNYNEMTLNDYIRKIFSHTGVHRIHKMIDISNK